VERVVLDTSVLIAGVPVADSFEAAISSVSIAELHFGLLVADDDSRPIRAARLGWIESHFSPLPVDDRVAREWGRLQAAVAARGAQPRRRAADLAIAATANVHQAKLLTHNIRDFNIISDLVSVGSPSAMI
jgi:predicted nucleic acid-binding protein